MQADIKILHGRKGDRQHQRNRQCHHHAGAPTQREKTHQQHNHQRFHQHLNEFAHPGFHRRWLIGNLAQLHTDGKAFLKFGKRLVQVLTQLKNVPAFFHGNSNTNGIFSHETHARLERVTEATVHIGDVIETQGAVVDLNREVANVIYAGEFTRYAQTYTIGRGFKKTGIGNRILRL